MTVLGALEKTECSAVVGYGVRYSQLGQVGWCLRFCLLILSITETGMLKSPNIIGVLGWMVVVVAQFLSQVWLFGTPWITARQASLSFAISHDLLKFMSILGLPRWLRGQRICLQCRIPGLIPRPGTAPGEGNNYLFQYSCLGNSMSREAWQATDCGIL